MRFELSPGSRVFVDLQATGLLRAVGHDPTLSARPEAATFDLGDGQVTLRFPVVDIEVPEDLSVSDRQKMLENLRGPEVLDAGRFPVIEVRGRYDGTVEGGELLGDVVVRGGVHRVPVTLKVTHQWDVLVASGVWEGKLTDLGIKPFKALFGALKLKDWIRLRIQARARPCP